MNAVLCPEDDVLVAFVLGERLPRLQAHIETCSTCRRRSEELKVEMTTLRLLGPGNSTESVGPAAIAPPVADSPQHVERPPMLGKYFIVGALAEGGQAAVFRALHPTLGKDVAIKWGKQALPDDGADHHALVAEGKLLAELDHSNLVRVLDLDFQDGRPFLVMEFVRGGDLEQYAKENRLTPKEAAALVAKVARAVAAAHRRGITHQDIKPRNIFIDEAGQPRLGDFGIARIRQAFAAEDQPVGGTLGYMSPEQACGDAEHIGPASDIFALGGVLHFLLVGKPPVAGDNPYLLMLKTGAGQIDLPALNDKKLPRPLLAICRRALAAQPADRFRSADALADVLDRFGQQPQRQRALVGALATLLLIALGAYYLRPSPNSGPPAAFRSNRDSAAPAQYLIDGVIRGQPPNQVGLGGLLKAVPLQAGDAFTIACDIPSGMHPVLVSVDTEGKLDIVPEPAMTLTSGNGFNRLVYPAVGALRLNGPGGTEFVLLCAGKYAPPAEVLQPLLQDDKPWPRLPNTVLVLVNNDHVETKFSEAHRGMVLGQADSLRTIEARLERLRQELGKHKIDFFIGVAYPHLD